MLPITIRRALISGLGTNQGKIGVERVGVLGANHFVEIVGSREATGDFAVLFQDGDVRISVRGEMVGSRDAEAACSKDQY